MAYEKGWDRWNQSYTHGYQRFTHKAHDENDVRLLRLSVAVCEDVTPLIHAWGYHPGVVYDTASEWATTVIENLGLPKSQKVRCMLLRRRELIPMSNEEFVDFFRQRFTDWNLNDGAGENPRYGRGWYYTWLNRYNSGHGVLARERVDEILWLYYGNNWNSSCVGIPTGVGEPGRPVGYFDNSQYNYGWVYTAYGEQILDGYQSVPSAEFLAQKAVYGVSLTTISVEASSAANACVETCGLMAVERVSVACTSTPRARRRRLFAAYYDVDAMPNVRLVNATLAALTLELNKGDLAVAVTSSDPVQTLRAVATETATTDTFVADAAEATVANQALFVAESNVLAGEADVAQANAVVTNANAGYGSITFTSAESRYTRTGESDSNDSGFLFWFGLLVVVALAAGAVVLVVGVLVLAWLAKGRKGKGKAAGTGAGGERKVAPVKSDAKPTATPSRSALTNAKAPPARSSKVVPKR